MWGGKDRDEAPYRRLHQAEELAHELGARGQVREGLELLRRDGLAVEKGGLDLQVRVRLAEGVEHLREGDDVLRAVGDARHPGEVLLQGSEGLAFDRAERERVLDGGNREALVVDEERVHRLRDRALHREDFRVLRRAGGVHSAGGVHDATFPTSFSAVAGSTAMPGPIVEERTTERMYFPFAVAGFAFWTAESSASVFSTSCFSPKEIFPTGTWMMAVLSTRNSILPALSSVTALPTSNVTVPAFGFGIRPRGQNSLPRRPSDFNMSGVATRASKSSMPARTFATRSP